ncbi:MAG: nucleotidyl transferase AbiEii/AbiGii toxin family protein [Candidatus Wildermuthbacteria bacterium]|nr:nucleotidyl transferase AbiEii/AbiGii toxin family protein [Candidatus Wildermuthbacteria bacterium]
MSKGILTKTQQVLLERIGENAFLSQKFYLTGGTALAAFYLRHRYSEDLDFFSEEEINIMQLDVALKELQKKRGSSKGKCLSK